MEGTVFRAPETARLVAMVDDRPAEKVFRVDRSIYTDPEAFEAEIKNIFEGSWIFACHESQVAKPGDYFALDAGRQPVVIWRQPDGDIKGFINACSHRAAILMPYKQGNAKTITCRFHGWTYGSDGGKCLRIKGEDTGYDGAFDRSQYDMKQVPRIGNYRGFVFVSLSADVPALEDFLGATKAWIDLMADQSTEGLEVVPGASSYTIGGNWKMQAENGVDGYHVSTVHRVFASTMSARQSRDNRSGMAQTEAGRIVANVPTASYDLGNGHMAIRALHTTPEVRPIWERRDELKARLPAGKVDWILNHGRNLMLFPNVLLMDNPSTQIRVMKPVAPDRTEVTVYCVAPKGESKQARFARLRKFEDFYLTAGMATSDDVSALEDTYAGSHARYARWNEMVRGWDQTVKGADAEAKKAGFVPVTSNPNWDHEILFHGFYRHWARLIGKTNGTNGKTNGA